MFYRRIAITSLLLVIIGLAGLSFILLNTLPTLGPRWLFFFFLLIGVSGLAMPVVAFLNYRFRGNFPVEGPAIVREALFIGIWADLLAWLQMGGELTPTSGLIITTGFILIEALLRVGDRSHWKPK